MKLPALPRKLTRLPRGKVKNPFKGGTSSIKRNVSRAAKVMGGASAFMAATPGVGYATGALGAALGGPKGAAIGFSAGAALDSAITARLALAGRRRGKLGSYLSRRSKRKSGVYKGKPLMSDSIDALYAEIEKAARNPFGMGSRRLASRLERKRESLNVYRQHTPPAHKGLPYNRASVKPGKEAQAAKLDRAIAAMNRRAPRALAVTPRFGAGKGKRRVGVYKAMDELDAAIEKASKTFRGQRMSSGLRRHLSRGNVFHDAASRTSDKDQKGVARRLKRAGAGVNSAALKRSLKLRAKRAR